jgi:hypothetical protein
MSTSVSAWMIRNAGRGYIIKIIKKLVFWTELAVLDLVGAASSRDRFNSRLEAAPTGVFFL